MLRLPRATLQHAGAALLALAALGAAGYLGLQWLAGPPDALTELRQANPGWVVEQRRHVGLRLSDGQGPELFVNADDAGPLRLQRLDCAQLLPSLPAWARLPPGRTVACLQMGDSAPFVRVLNQRTPLPIGELWTRHYEPQLAELQLPYWGGSTGSDSAASGARNRRAAMSYSVDPAPGSSDPLLNLMAFHLGDETVLVMTLRPPPRP